MAGVHYLVDTNVLLRLVKSNDKVKTGNNTPRLQFVVMTLIADMPTAEGGTQASSG